MISNLRFLQPEVEIALEKRSVSLLVLNYPISDIRPIISKNFNPSVTKSIGTHIGYQGGRAEPPPPQVSDDSLDLET